MDKTLGYLRETLSNYTDESSLGRHLYRKLTEEKFTSEGSFVRQLSEKEIDFLNFVLQREIHYAQEEKDEKRAYELNEVYELLI